jgi:hypothetical protein
MADLKEGEIDELLSELDALDKRASAHFPPPAAGTVAEAESMSAQAPAAAPASVTPPLKPRNRSHSRSGTLASLALDGKPDDLPVVDRRPATPNTPTSTPSPKADRDTTPTKPKLSTTPTKTTKNFSPATPVGSPSTPVVPSPSSQRTVNASPSTNTLFSEYSGRRDSNYSAASTARTTPPASPEVEMAREKGDIVDHRISESSERDAEALEELVASYDRTPPAVELAQEPELPVFAPAPAPAPAATEVSPPSPPPKPSPTTPEFSALQVPSSSPVRTSSLRYRTRPVSQNSQSDDIPPPPVPPSPSSAQAPPAVEKIQPDSVPSVSNVVDEEKKARAREVAEHDEKIKAGSCQCIIS